MRVKKLEPVKKLDQHHLGVYGKERFFPDILLVKGDGSVVTDSEGRKYHDFVGGIAAVSVGHNNPTIEQRVNEYKAGKGIDHISNLFYIGPQAEYAERLAGIVPIDDAVVFFCNSGGEATEGALKLASKNSGENSYAVYFSGSFHGRNGVALATTGQPHKQEGFERSIPRNTVMLGYNNFEDLGRITEDTYAVIIELIQGEGGIISAQNNYIKAMVKRLYEIGREKQEGPSIIIDEVQTGFGRTGRMFATEYYLSHNPGFQPDAICMAKGIANGYPFGAIALGPRLAGKISAGDHATTFGGNAEACIRADAVLDIIADERLLENALYMEKVFYTRYKWGELDHVKEARGRGVLLGIEMDTADNRNKIIKMCVDDRVLFAPSGSNVVRIVPPLNITEKQFKYAMKVLYNNIKRL